MKIARHVNHSGRVKILAQKWPADRPSRWLHVHPESDAIAAHEEVLESEVAVLGFENRGIGRRAQKGTEL